MYSSRCIQKKKIRSNIITYIDFMGVCLQLIEGTTTRNIYIFIGKKAMFHKFEIADCVA